MHKDDVLVSIRGNMMSVAVKFIEKAFHAREMNLEGRGVARDSVFHVVAVQMKVVCNCRKDGASCSFSPEARCSFPRIDLILTLQELPSLLRPNEPQDMSIRWLQLAD